MWFRQKGLNERIKAADQKGYLRAKKEYEDWARREVQQVRRECEIVVAEKEAVIDSHLERIRGMQDHVNAATHLSSRCVHYISHVMALVAEKTMKSNLFVDLSVQSHQQQLALEESLKNAHTRATEEIGKYKKLLER